MKCFPHLSLLCSQTPTPSHFGSIIYFIARDFIDHISCCTNLALYILSYCHVLSYRIDSELLRVTVLNIVETYDLCVTDFPERQSVEMLDDSWVVWRSFSHHLVFITVLHHACYKSVSAGEREWGGINKEKDVSGTMAFIRMQF